MREWWSTRWYTPLLVLGAGLLVLLFLALAMVEVLTAAVPTTVAPRTAALDGGQRGGLIEVRDAGPSPRAWIATPSRNARRDSRTPGGRQP